MTKILAVIGGITALLGVPIGYVTIQLTERSTVATESAEKRAQQEDEEKKKREAGPPVQQALGAPAFYGSRFAFPGRTTDLEGGGEAGYGTKEYADWFAKNEAAAVGVDAFRVTLSPLHEGTVVIQNMRISDRECQPTRYTGTAVVPPAIGDGGDDIEPTSVGFDLTAPAPKPRKISGPKLPKSEPGVEVWRLEGNAFAKGIYLDGGDKADARSFDLYFFTGSNDCEFKVEVNITSGTEDAWYPLKLGKGDSVKVAGQADHYDSVVLPREVDYTDPVQNELHGPGNPFNVVRLEKAP